MNLLARTYVEVPDVVIRCISAWYLAEKARGAGCEKIAMIKFLRKELTLDLVTAKDLVEAILQNPVE